MEGHLSLHQLELFCAVAEHGSFVEAARRLYLTQPSLSGQVKALERVLGVKLFERRYGRTVLTEAGRISYDFAQNLLTLERRFRAAVEDFVKPEFGTLAIGSSRPFGRNVIPDVVSEFVRAHEQVEVSVVYKDTEALYQELLNRTLDVGVVTGDASIPVPPGLEAVTLPYDHWTLVASKDAPWAQHPCLEPELFAQAPLITGVQHSTHWKLIQKLLADLGLRPGDYTVRLRMEDLDAIKVTVLGGLGIAFLPFSLVQDEIRRGELVAFAFPREEPPLHCVIVAMPQSQLRPTVSHFVEFLLSRLRGPANMPRRARGD